jgi:hypothetical protein
LDLDSAIEVPDDSTEERQLGYLYKIQSHAVEIFNEKAVD